jgi:hypothetical protein
MLWNPGTGVHPCELLEDDLFDDGLRTTVRIDALRANAPLGTILIASNRGLCSLDALGIGGDHAMYLTSW